MNSGRDGGGRMIVRGDKTPELGFNGMDHTNKSRRGTSPGFFIGAGETGNGGGMSSKKLVGSPAGGSKEMNFGGASKAKLSV